MNNGDPRFPYPRYLKVPFVFVPKGSPPPLEWMAAHPHHFTVPGFFIPHSPSKTDMTWQTQPGAEGHAELPPDGLTYEEPAPEPEVEL